MGHPRWAYMAEHIPGARLVELPGADFLPALGEQEPVFAELESFLADVAAGTHPEIEPDRVLATVLFSDIGGSSERAATLGDRPWRELLLRHHELVRSQLVRFRGQEVDTAGDGKVAGIAVHTGARVAANAQPGEVLVSSTVKDLVAGSGLTFEDRGSHELKGIPGEWRLYAVAR
jgi:class 3 adenylate cyclase